MTHNGLSPCRVCGTGRVVPGDTAITLTRGQATIVVRHVPADVCDACGEAYTSEAVAAAVQAIGDAAIAAGVTSQVSDYRPTPVTVSA